MIDTPREKDDGAQADLFSGAFDLAYDRGADLLYVSSTSLRRIVVLRGSDGSVLRHFGPRVGHYEIGVPLGLGLDADGNLYVVDGRKNTVAVLTREGGLVRVITAQRQAGESEQRLIDVAILPSGTVFVTDNANGQVIVFELKGREILRWALPGPEEGPLAGITKIAATAAGDLVVVDGLSQKVHLVSPGGAPIFAFGELKAWFDGFLSIGDAAPLDDGHVLVADVNPALVTEFGLRVDPGSYVATLGWTDHPDVALPLLFPLAIAGNGKDLLLVLDNLGGRISAFRFDMPGMGR